MAGDERLAIARVYGDALLDLADADGRGEELLAELEAFIALLERERAAAVVLTSPVTDAEARLRVLERALRGRASDLLVDFLQVASRKGRLGLLPEIAAAYRQALDRRHGRIDVRVTTAVPLGDDLRRALRAAVAHATGREARLEERQDPTLLGGAIVRIGDRKLDNSLRGQLGKLKAALAARASREILSGRPYWETEA